MAFEAYVDHVLAPSLRPGQVVVLDNLSVHKGERVRQAIEARGCQVLFRPSYSPDVTPIEEAFSKLKAWLRRLGARTRERLEEPSRGTHADLRAGCPRLVLARWLSVAEPGKGRSGVALA